MALHRPHVTPHTMLCLIWDYKIKKFRALRNFLLRAIKNTLYRIAIVRETISVMFLFLEHKIHETLIRLYYSLLNRIFSKWPSAWKVTTSYPTKYSNIHLSFERKKRKRSARSHCIVTSQGILFFLFWFYYLLFQ